MSRAAFASAWIALVVVAFGPLAPAEPRPDQTAWLLRLLTGDWAAEEPAVVAEFQLMGVWPLAMAVLLRRHWADRPVPAWPFLLGSFALGCFVLLPWFVIHPRPITRPAPTRGVLLAAGALGVAAAGWIGWALVAGDLGAFVDGVGTDPFLWAMTWDFTAFTALFAVTLARSEPLSG